MDKYELFIQELTRICNKYGLSFSINKEGIFLKDIDYNIYWGVKMPEAGTDNPYLQLLAMIKND